jgi:hypothetical protein
MWLIVTIGKSTDINLFLDFLYLILQLDLSNVKFYII